MLLSKLILESNVTRNITIKVISFSTVPPIVNGGDWGCIVRDLETIVLLVLLAFNLIPKKVSPLTNPAKVTDQILCYCNSNAWGWLY